MVLQYTFDKFLLNLWSHCLIKDLKQFVEVHNKEVSGIESNFFRHVKIWLCNKNNTNVPLSASNKQFSHY